MRKPLVFALLLALALVFCMGCASSPVLPSAGAPATTFQRVDPSNTGLMAARTFQRADRLKLTRP